MTMAHRMEAPSTVEPSAPVARRAPVTTAVRQALKADHQHSPQEQQAWFATFMWYFNTVYFAQSAAGLAYQNGQQFAYAPTDLAIYLPVIAAWMLFAGAAARAQCRVEQGDTDSLQRHHPVTAMRCFIAVEALVRGLKNVNWVLTVAGEAATAHGAHLGMVGATGLTQCAGLALSLFTPIGAIALASGVVVGAMDAGYRHAKATRDAAGKMMDELGAQQFEEYCAECDNATFSGFLAKHNVQADAGERNAMGAAALASGLIHGAYRVANALFIVKLISVTAASTLLGPAAPIFLGLFAAYAVGNALYSLFKEGREQAALHQKRSDLYDRLFPGARQLYAAQRRLQQEYDRLHQARLALENKQQRTAVEEHDLAVLQEREAATQAELDNTVAKLNAKETVCKADGIILEPPPKPPQTFAHGFYQFCSSSAAWFGNTVGAAFAAVETTINTVKNGCKLGACIAGLGLTMMAMEHPVAQVAGLVTMAVGLAIGAVGLFCGLFSAGQQYGKDSQRQATLANSSAAQDSPAQSEQGNTASQSDQGAEPSADKTPRSALAAYAAATVALPVASDARAAA